MTYYPKLQRSLQENNSLEQKDTGSHVPIIVLHLLPYSWISLLWGSQPIPFLVRKASGVCCLVTRRAAGLYEILKSESYRRHVDSLSQFSNKSGTRDFEYCFLRTEMELKAASYHADSQAFSHKWKPSTPFKFLPVEVLAGIVARSQQFKI